MVQGQKYHYLYKTTCLVTGSYYIGIHSTENLEDEYLGSGKRLGYSIQKHGRENHFKEILEFFETREDLKSKEREVVNEEKLLDPRCMNLARGGEGGFINREAAAAGGRVAGKKIDPETARRNIAKARSMIFERTGSKNGRKGKIGVQVSLAHRIAIGNAMKISQRGEKNSQFGKWWITKDGKSIKIPREEYEKWEIEGWKRGRN